VAFWGRTLFCLLICCSGLLGATRQTFYCRAFFWPGDQSRPFRAARSFCFVGAAIGAAQCLFCCSGLLGPRVIFVCCCGFLGPRNDSVLWARPFGAAPCFLFLSQRSLGPHVNFSTVAAFFGSRNDPICGHGLSRPRNVWSCCRVLRAARRFVCCHGPKRPCDNSVLLMQPFRAAQCFVVIRAAFWGRSVPLSVIATFLCCVTILLCGNGLWGCALTCLLFVAVAFLGPHVNFSIVTAFFGPGDQSWPLWAACIFRFAGAAFGAVQCFVVLQQPFGAMHRFCWLSRHFRPRNDSALWAWPFGAVPCFCFCLRGRTSIFQLSQLFLGCAMTPFVGVAFQGHAMFGLSLHLVGLHVILFVAAAQSGHATILFCWHGLRGRAMFCCHRSNLLGLLIALVCHCDLFKPRDDSTLWVQPFGAVHSLVFYFCRSGIFGAAHQFFYRRGLFRAWRSFHLLVRPSGHVMSCFLSQGPFGTAHCICLSSRP